jgi:GTP pyrophosphokinase
VQGRPKHLYSIWRKMQGKALDFDRVFDLRALRVVVADVLTVTPRWRGCTRASRRSGRVRRLHRAPKPNGYQSLHTVVRDADGKPVEVQIRTRPCTSMPSTAWPRTGPTRRPAPRAMPASAPRATTTPKRAPCCASCWPGSATCPARPVQDKGLFDDRIYVFTPQAAVVELPAGATPVDFAYTVHTDLGHRCRGARSTARWCR